MEFELRGITDAQRQLAAAMVSAPAGLGTGLYREAEAIMTISKSNYVPVATGALRESGFVHAVETPAGVSVVGGETVVGFNTHVTMGYGGPAAPYALIVHEDLTKRHTVGQAKYLETPIKARLGGMVAILKLWTENAMRQAIQRKQKMKANLRAGRDENWGMPLFRGGDGAAG